MLCGAVLMPAAIFAPLVPAAWMAIAATCFVTLGHAFWVANLQTLPTDLFKGQEMGTATGFSGMGGAIGGMLASAGHRVGGAALQLHADLPDSGADAPAVDRADLQAAAEPVFQEDELSQPARSLTQRKTIIPLPKRGHGKWRRKVNASGLFSASLRLRQLPYFRAVTVISMRASGAASLLMATVVRDGRGSLKTLV